MQKGEKILENYDKGRTKSEEERKQQLEENK